MVCPSIPSTSVSRKAFLTPSLPPRYSSPVMWHFVRIAVFALLALVAAVSAPAASPAFVEDSPPVGFHPFCRPSRSTPSEQWAHVQNLARAGRDSRAASQARALRLFWPFSPEAPRAQLFYARSLDDRGKSAAAFEAYQLLLTDYGSACDFDAVLERQLDLAKTVFDARHAKFLFFPGFLAPEKSIPLFQKIIDVAPEGPGAPEAAYRIGLAHEQAYEFEKAIDAFFSAMTRFPASPFAAEAATGLVRCRVYLADDTPQDARARDSAIAACDFFLTRFPAATNTASVTADRARLFDRRVQASYDLALYYDRQLRDPVAAAIRYREFLALYPNSPLAATARRRLDQLEPPTQESES